MRDFKPIAGSVHYMTIQSHNPSDGSITFVRANGSTWHNENTDYWYGKKIDALMSVLMMGAIDLNGKKVFVHFGVHPNTTSGEVDIVAFSRNYTEV